MQGGHARVAREFSLDDPEVLRLGGDLGWMPLGSADTYASSILSLEEGVVSEPITDLDNPKLILFFMVSEREEARALSPADLEEFKVRALQNWVNEERVNHDIYAAFDSEIYDWMLKQMRQSDLTTPTPAPPIGF